MSKQMYPFQFVIYIDLEKSVNFITGCDNSEKD